MSSTKVFVRFDGFGIGVVRTGSVFSMVGVSTTIGVSVWYLMAVVEAKEEPIAMPIVGGGVVKDWHDKTLRTRHKAE